MKKKLPTVSACMIVKDEEEMLPRCLESIKWVDELIVVDTGSIDKTAEIAGSFGAKVYHHPWENDFSLHRNQSIGYATSDWILIIDADEKFTGNIKKRAFKKRLSKLHPSVACLCVNVTEKGKDRLETTWLGLRFFRRDSNIQYKGIVHNKASYEGGCAGTDIKIEHYGYSLGPDAMAKKQKRTQKLLMDRLKDNEDDFNALYYLTQLRVGQKRWDDALEFGTNFFQIFPVKDPTDWHFYSVMYLYMSWIYMHKNDGEKAFAWAKKGLDMFPGDLDLNYIAATLGWMSKREDILTEYGENYFALLPNARKKGLFNSEEFVNPVRGEDWVNRTVYTSDKITEDRLRKMMEAF